MIITQIGHHLKIITPKKFSRHACSPDNIIRYMHVGQLKTYACRYVRIIIISTHACHNVEIHACRYACILANMPVGIHAYRQTCMSLYYLHTCMSQHRHTCMSQHQHTCMSQHRHTCMSQQHMHVTTTTHMHVTSVKIAGQLYTSTYKSPDKDQPM